MASSRVFADTNVLFEAFRVGAWNRFGGAYSVRLRRRELEVNVSAARIPRSLICP
jgi:hypothetical protein